MSETGTSNSENNIINKITNFVTSKKGMYLVGTIILLGVVYYYTMCGKKKSCHKYFSDLHFFSFSKRRFKQFLKGASPRIGNKLRERLSEYWSKLNHVR